MGFDTCTILGDVTVVNPSILNCEIHGTIYHNAISSPIQFNVTGNRFLEGNGYNLRSIVPNSIVAGSWINNYSALNFHFIILDRTNLDPNEQNHTYKYSGNTGPYTLQRDSAKWSDVVFTGPSYVRDRYGATQNKTIFWEGTDENALLATYYGRQFSEEAPNYGTTDGSYYLSEFNIFSVGTTNLGEMSLRMQLPQKLTEAMKVAGPSTPDMPHALHVYGSYASLDDVEKAFNPNPTAGLPGVPKGYTFKSGYTWRINYAQGMAVLRTDNTYPTVQADWEIPVKYELAL
jgi:hypothetical protein